MSAQNLKFFLDLNRVHAVISRQFDATLGGLHGIGLNDLQLLHTLEQAPEQRLRRIDLAQRLGVTASGVTWMLRPLIKRRLVISQPSESDARVAFAALTDSGRRLLSDAVPTARHLAGEVLEAHLGKQEVANLAALMARLG
jgi:DNA-binding MarR family transcriptional regulator